MKNIIVGSTNPLKIEAVREACRRFFTEEKTISGVQVSSSYKQPVGLDQTYAAAYTRAFFARETGNTTPGIETGNINIGIENGIVFIDKSTTIDLAVIVIITPHNKTIVSTSAGVPVDPQDMWEAKRRGFTTTTVGSIRAERLKCNPADPHSSITGGIVTRKDLLVNALVIAFSQL